MFTPFTLGGAYDLILGFNDGMRVDSDYDDIVVGLKVVAIPEPETYALLMAGLGAVGFIARRRRKSRLPSHDGRLRLGAVSCCYPRC